MNVCEKCAGKGAVRPAPRGRRMVPCFWFNQGAETCPACDGTGETDEADHGAPQAR